MLESSKEVFKLKKSLFPGVQLAGEHREKNWIKQKREERSLVLSHRKPAFEANVV